jgi:hypothetical protein
MRVVRRQSANYIDYIVYNDLERRFFPALWRKVTISKLQLETKVAYKLDYIDFPNRKIQYLNHKN